MSRAQLILSIAESGASEAGEPSERNRSVFETVSKEFLVRLLAGFNLPQQNMCPTGRNV